ncbi:cupin domain-containing protein [Emticicia sp. BO119]|uniref:cupin domain-containing protein n=1 Tax=Emticicia sp. BO119 TaxID=2757768 RepID=UPI0015F0BB47|nr:cupin domain-containing protein [Emticicia sp. BO119]MBA4849971.1 cupin domain-containing protein [Emticicia sp. BO119]
MKLSLFLTFFCYPIFCVGQETFKPIEAKIYHWADAAVNKKENMEQRSLLEGSSVAFKHIKIHATTVYPHQTPHQSHRHDEEEMIIIKEGELTVTIEGKTQTLGAGSVALMMSGEEHGFENKSNSNVTYYVMRYDSREPKNLERGNQAGGSFMINWKDIPFQAHDKGGIRKFFDKPTAMSRRFEMHVTTLKEGMESHPPHTHKAAEILLPIDNIAEEHIAGNWIMADIGDIIFLESNVPHAIRNIGKGTVTYFAFQFE